MADLHIERLDFDPDCPLLDVPGHECANRDWAERRAAGVPVLRPGSRCFEGDAYAISVEAQARDASLAVLAAAQSLLAVMAEYGYLRGDCGVEAQLLADATGIAGFALSLAGWKP